MPKKIPKETSEEKSEPLEELAVEPKPRPAKAEYYEKLFGGKG